MKEKFIKRKYSLAFATLTTLVAVLSVLTLYTFAQAQSADSKIIAEYRKAIK